MKTNNLKNSFILALCMLASISTYAVPAKRVWRTVTLTDGTQIEAMLVGDEHGHWLIDRNGKALNTNSGGKAYYMTAEEFSERKEMRKQRAAKSNALRVEKITKTRALSAQTTSNGPRKTFGQPTTIIGKKKGLVILVNFSDLSFKAANNKALFERRFNEVGYNDKGYIGSVHDYFYDQSYGKFDLEFDIVGPVTVSKSHDYYGANNKDGNDKYPATMVIEALKLADAQGVDFSKYDWDGDGEVDQVFVIFAGTGEAVSNKENDIWPHEYSLYEAQKTGDGSGKQYIDGKYIDTYACSCEMATSTTIDGIGTACHEFSHCLGYADLYDIDYSGGQGMMYWDLLDAGSYNGPESNGEVPAAYTSFERWWAGWMEPVVLSKPQNIKDMPALNDTAVAYKIINDAHPDEYYLLENRQAKRWDSYTACDNNGRGHGMMILHVDYNESVWKENEPNDDPSRQRMTFFPADNSYGTKTLQDGLYYWSSNFAQSAGDPFPGTSRNTSFTDDSTPAATLYNKNSNGTMKMGKPITLINETNGLISFSFMRNALTPKVEETSITSPTSFTASWSAVDDAISYTVRTKPIIKKPVQESCILNETFSKITKTNSVTDVSKLIDNYTDNAGWSASKVYQDYTDNIKSIKVGTATAVGTLTTPALNITTGQLTLAVNCKNYKTDKNYIVANICDKDGKQLQADEIETTTSFTTNVLSFDISVNPCKIMFMPAKRAYIHEVKVFDGEFTADEINSLSTNTAKADIAQTTVSGDTITVSGITDTSYTFTDLTNDKYQFQVKAVLNDGSETDWSAPVMVTFDVALIVDIKNNDNPADNRIFNINGQLVGTDINSLGKGIYIVNRKKIIKH